VFSRTADAESARLEEPQLGVGALLQGLALVRREPEENLTKASWVALPVRFTLHSGRSSLTAVKATVAGKSADIVTFNGRTVYRFEADGNQPPKK
jgi:hypothetical protein